MLSRLASAGSFAPARAALGAFVLISGWLAIAPAVDGSRVVLSTSGGSPDWLIGPFQFAGAQALAGANAGWMYYSGLMAAMALFALLVWMAPRLSMRSIVATVVGLHALFLLAPPLLSHDVFSYIAYARLGVEHGLNPYAFRPLDIPGDPIFPFAGSKGAVSVYGPFFTLATYPLGWLSVPVAFWILKGVAAASSLGLIAIVRRLAARVGADEKRAVVLLGLCPATLVHVVGGAHNEALTMLLLFGGVILVASPGTGVPDGARSRFGGLLAAASVGIKASTVVPLPFMLIAARNRLRLLAGMIAAGVLALALGLIAFGADALNGLNLISSNQDHTSRYSVPHRTVDALHAIFGPLDRAAATDVVRSIFLLILAIVVAWLLVRTWRRPEQWLASAGWATLGVLLASAWLVPWYLLWLLPFAAVARSRALIVATIAFAAYTMGIAIPF